MIFEKWIPKCFEGLDEKCIHGDCLDISCLNCEFGKELNPIIHDKYYLDRYKAEYERSYLAGEIL